MQWIFSWFSKLGFQVSKVFFRVFNTPGSSSISLEPSKKNEKMHAKEYFFPSPVTLPIFSPVCEEKFVSTTQLTNHIVFRLNHHLIHHLLPSLLGHQTQRTNALVHFLLAYGGPMVVDIAHARLLELELGLQRGDTVEDMLLFQYNGLMEENIYGDHLGHGSLDCHRGSIEQLERLPEDSLQTTFQQRRLTVLNGLCVYLHADHLIVHHDGCAQ